ncbi:MAG: Yip1 family protein [Sphingomonas sp.]
MASAPPSGMIERIKNIITSPKAEWAKIDAEPMTDRRDLHGLGTGARGDRADRVGDRAACLRLQRVRHHGATLADLRDRHGGGQLCRSDRLHLCARARDRCARAQFRRQKNSVQALKVAAYSATASWVAGIFGIIPQISFLSIVGLYSLYLLFVGLPILMRVPKEKAAGYTIVTIVVAIVVYIVVGAISSAVIFAFAPPTLPAAALSFTP